MSLTMLSGKVAAKYQKGVGSLQTIGESVVRGLTGNSSFLRNEDNSIGTTLSNISSLANTTKDLFSILGAKSPEYVIGRIEKNDIDFGGYDKFKNGVAGTVARAVSSLKAEGGQERGVIIDGFDNIKGESKVALPSQPVMYRPDMNNTRVPQPKILTMRVYVSNEYADNILDNLIDTTMNAFGGLGNLVVGSEQTRAQRAYSNLEWIQKYGTPFKVYTTHGVYENMLIKDMVPTNDKTTNDLLTVDITFKEIILTQSLESGAKSPARSEPSAIVNSLAKVFKFF